MGIGNLPPSGYAHWLLTYTRHDGVRGHYLTGDRQKALRKAEAGEGAGWRSWTLYGCDPVEAWEKKETALERHMAKKRGA